MPFANPNYTDILATTIENRSKTVADNVTKNNAILMKLSMKGKIKKALGGNKIIQELSFAENSNTGWYSGYDLLPVGTSDVISAAEFNWKQAAAPVVISGLEQLQNAGKEQMIDLMESRLAVAESSMANLIAEGLYSDGTGAGGKQINGLDGAIQDSGTYGGIDRTAYPFWQAQLSAPTGVTAANIQGFMNAQWASQVRGRDMPDLILMDNQFWEVYVASLQTQQRFTDPTVGDLGFPTIKYQGADVCLDGGIGGFAGGTGSGAFTAFFLNCNYIHYRPHSSRDMVPLSPNARYSVNQDAETQILGWAGNMTCSGAQFQGRIDASA